MATLQVFDKPMCCSTGICGPKVDPVMPRFASDLAWLKEQGVEVERFNLAQQPQEFAGHDDVKAALHENADCLPLFRVDGQIVYKGKYPSRSMLARWCGASVATALPISAETGCGPTGCC